MNVKILSDLIRVFTRALSRTHPALMNPEEWNEKDLNKWFHTGKWRFGWNIIPDESINKKELAIQFFRNRDLWKKAFIYLKSTNLEKISTGRYELEGKDLYVIVDEYTTKNEDDALFEAHRVYTDIQYLVYGNERIGVTRLENAKEIIPYDNLKDISFFTVEPNNYRVASSERFFVFFPQDAHRPCVKIDNNSNVRKVVIKIRTCLRNSSY